MNKLDFWINWYNKEEERKHSLENSLNTPIGVLVLVFSALFFMFKEFDFENSSNTQSICLSIFAGISSLAIIIAAYFIIKAYYAKNYLYKLLPSPTILLKHEKDLIDYYAENKDFFEGVDANDKFNEYLIETLANCIDVNSKNNDKKSNFIHLAKKYIFYSIIALGLGFIPFFYNSITKPDPIQKIEIKSLDLMLKEIKTLNKNLEHGRRDETKVDTTTSTTSTTTKGSSRR